MAGLQMRVSLAGCGGWLRAINVDLPLILLLHLPPMRKKGAYE